MAGLLTGVQNQMSQSRGPPRRGRVYRPLDIVQVDIPLGH